MTAGMCATTAFQKGPCLSLLAMYVVEPIPVCFMPRALRDVEAAKFFV